MDIDTKEDIVLQQLNEDCLMLIFQHLDMPEQFSLLQMDETFERVVLRLWRIKYAKALDFEKENKIKLIPHGDLMQLLHIISQITRELHNVDGFVWMQFLKFWELQTFRNIIKFTVRVPYAHRLELAERVAGLFPNLKAFHMRNVQISLRTVINLNFLTDLQLVYCPINSDISGIFCSAPLERLELLPKASPTDGTEAITFQLLNSYFLPYSLKGIGQCTTLKVLKLCMADVVDVAEEIGNLPKLQQLTVFTVADDIETQLFTAQQQAIITTVRTAKLEQIVGLGLKCYIDKRLLPLLYFLPRLESFAWHAHLHVIYVVDGLKFQTYDPQMPHAILRLIHNCRQTLKMIDVRRNIQITDTFLNNLRTLLGGGDDNDLNLGGNIQIKHDDENELLETERVVNFSGDWKTFDNCGFFEFHFRSNC